MKPTLLILAAGMGSRFGGLKQVEPVGPGGEAIIDYSVFDAIKAGFGKVVFVIRENFADAFKEKFGNKFTGKIKVEYVFQNLENLPEGFLPPGERKKPWGTAHAILVAKDVINEPFCALNADDFYGYNAFKVMADFLKKDPNPSRYAMVGYKLKNTLSDFGSVSRGICEVNENVFLKSIVETTKILKKGEKIVSVDPGGNEKKLTGKETVSMNMWGFKPSIFNYLEKKFTEFLETEINKPKSELYIPSVVFELIEEGKATVKVLKTDSPWFGVTYKEDTPYVIEKLKSLTEKGDYPSGMLQLNLTAIANQFQLEGNVKEVKALGEGFINDTFIIKTEGASPDYILQRKNKKIFSPVPALMENIQKVCTHIKSKVKKAGGDPMREAMTIIPANDGKLYFQDEEDEYWAVSLFIDDTIAFEAAETPELAYAGGKGIGKFQSLVSDLKEPLADILPGFHNIRIRFEQWDDVLARDPLERKAGVAEDIYRIECRRNEMLNFWKLVENGTIPTRVSHNDTKINNILFDKKGDVLCVIDLDTVLNSTVLNDFGDAIRFYTNTGEEDDANLDNVSVDMEIFKAFTKGYLEEAASFLTAKEVEYLAFSARYITYEQVLRFLMDYIDGDNYYKTKSKDHNLVRTRAQYKLLTDMEKHSNAMNAAVQELIP